MATAKHVVEHRPCPICMTLDPFRAIGGYVRGSACSVVYRVPADPPLAECDVVICDDCGFTFSDTPTTQAEFDCYYAESTKYGPEVTGRDSWNEERYNHTAYRIAELISDATWSVLDVGSGAGGLGSELNRLDMHPTSTNAYLQHVPCPSSGRWRCVTLCHVLEHVRDLDPAMRNLAAIAETVYAEVPDAARYREFCESPYQQFNSEHVNHFTAEHLRRLFEHHGFAQVASGRGECGDPPPHMHPYIWGFFERAKSATDAVRAYCDRSAMLWQRVMEKVRSVRGPFIAWGNGQLHHKIRRELSTPELTKFACVVDRCGGDGVLTPDAVFGRYDASVPILVTTIQHRESVLEDIKRLQLKNEVITLP